MNYSHTFFNVSVTHRKTFIRSGSLEIWDNEGDTAECCVVKDSVPPVPGLKYKRIKQRCHKSVRSPNVPFSSRCFTAQARGLCFCHYLNMSQQTSVLTVLTHFLTWAPPSYLQTCGSTLNTQHATVAEWKEWLTNGPSGLLRSVTTAMNAQFIGEEV